MDKINNLLVLPLRDIVVLPSMVVPLFVGREKSIKSLNLSIQESKKIILIAQKDAEINDPEIDDFYEYGCVAEIVQLMKLPDGNIKVIVEGIKRAKILNVTNDGDYFSANFIELEDDNADDKENEALVRALNNSITHYSKLNKKFTPEIISSFSKISSASKLCDLVTAHITVKVDVRQKFLEENNVKARLEMVLVLVENEISLMETEKEIQRKVEKKLKKNQRDYYLNEQIKVIQDELGEGDEHKREINEYKEKIEKLKLSTEAKEKALSEVKKLGMMSAMSAESTVIRNYLDWMLNLPWKVYSKINKKLDHAEAILERDHYGLEKIKERILEYLAVQKRVNQIKGPILCFVGPPGVGKTSLARSIAEATGRQFAQISLGGINDVSEIKGHRRTYIGSMPGKLIQSLKKVKTSNPLILFDEIDKLGKDFRGDPSSALLEILDPEQNLRFNDHYLEVDYDLSKIMFIATANSLNLPKPLLDRMEIIRLEGYTEEEKLEIAKRHLIPKQLKDHGVSEDELSISDTAIVDIIKYYTREAGVRNLERYIAKLARKVVKKLEDNKSKNLSKIKITENNLNEYLGIYKFSHGELEDENMVGVVNGLAYTEYGGDILKIESVTVNGKGNIKYTGKLGEVMQESVQAAYSLIRSRSQEYGIKPTKFEAKDIHVHVPEGATPKDGPSAGAAIAVTIASVMTKIPIKKDIAMTGEITLRGKILAIGGLKEKLLAALRSNVKTVLIPFENKKDLEEIPSIVKDKLKIIPVATFDEVISHALVTKPVAIEWEDIEVIDNQILSKTLPSTAH